MSGAFVQRGEPAFFDKWHRAAWAIEGGADAVIELPAVYALSSASGFALGGVTLAARLGCQSLACGVEAGTAEDFLSLARRADTLEIGPETAKKGSSGQAQTPSWQRPPTRPGFWSSPMPCWLLNTPGPS